MIRPTLRTLTDEKFEEIYTNKKFRNEVAFAHVCCDSAGKELHKKTCSYPDEYIVDEYQVRKAQLERIRSQKETKKEYFQDLVFVGMGCPIDNQLTGYVTNHRFRTEFLTNDGMRVFIEFSTTKKNTALYCTHSINRSMQESLGDNHYNQSKYYNYKNLERGGCEIAATFDGVLNLINTTFNCNFKRMIIDEYDLTADGLNCISPDYAKTLNKIESFMKL